MCLAYPLPLPPSKIALAHQATIFSGSPNIIVSHHTIWWTYRHPPPPTLKLHILLASSVKLLHYQPFGSNTPSLSPPHRPADRIHSPPLSD